MVVDGLLALCRRAAAAIRTAWNTAAPTDDPAGAVVVDVDLAAVDVAVIVYIHHGEFRRRHLLAEARRHLARELRGRRAEPGLDDRITEAAIRAYCVDVTPPRSPGRRPRPPGHAIYTAAWHPSPPLRRDAAQGLEDTVVELSVHDRAVATSIRIQALLRVSRAPTRPVQPGRAARVGKPSPADQAVATVLYEQLAFGDDADVQEDQDDDQEQEFVISPERREWLQELQRRVGELARDVPKAKATKRRGGTTATPPPGYRPRR